MSSLAFFTVEYDTDRYDFRSWAEVALGVDDLSRLHAVGTYGPYRPNDGGLRAKWNGRLTARLPQLEELLRPFRERELTRYFVAVPKVRYPPMLRVHPPGYDSISPVHKDSDYGLAAGAINVWIPLTRVWDSNALWVESESGRGDFRPVPLRYGQALLFDAVRLAHGSRTNETDVTRVSFDFRCHGRLRAEYLRDYAANDSR